MVKCHGERSASAMGQFAVAAALVAFFTSTAAGPLIEVPHIKLDDFEPCDDNEDLVLEIMNHEVERVSKNTISVNATFEVKAEMPEDLVVIIEFKRCESESEKYSCKHFMTERIEDFCQHINDPSAAWSNVVENTKPKLSCPIQPNTYQTINGQVDASFLNKAPEGYWMVQAKSEYNGAMRSCARCSARIWPDFINDDDADE